MKTLISKPSKQAHQNQDNFATFKYIIELYLRLRFKPGQIKFTFKSVLHYMLFYILKQTDKLFGDLPGQNYFRNTKTCRFPEAM